MDGVREGIFWLPQMDECKLRKIASAPPINDLADICSDEIDAHVTATDGMSEDVKQAMNNTSKRLRKFPADIDWMVGILYTIKPEHPIFSKSYVVPKKVTAMAMKKPDLDATFFAGLPLSKMKRKTNCTLGAPRLSKLEREQQRIAKLEEKLEMQKKKTAF